MEFLIPKRDLVRELQTVTGVVEKRATLPILANLLLEARAKGLEMGASDLEVTIRGRVDATVTKEGSLTLPAIKLYDIARSLPESDVQFKLLDRNQVAISCQRTRFRISGQPRDEFPQFPEVDPSKGLRLPAATLSAMIDRVSFAISLEDPRYALQGALLLIQEGSLTLVATDGYRLAFALAKGSFKVAQGEHRLIVPRKTLSEVRKLADAVGKDETLVFGRSGNHIFFVVGGHTLTSTVPAEVKFPNYEEVIPKSCQTTVCVSAEELKDAVRRVALLASDRHGKTVKFTLTKGKLELSSSAEAGEASESLAVNYSGEEKTIGFNARYIEEFLAAVGTPAVMLDLDPLRGEGADASRGTGDKPAQLRPEPPGDLEYRYVVMPRDL